MAITHMFSLLPSSNHKNGVGKQGTALVVVSENTIISVSSLKKDKLTIAAAFPQAFSRCCWSLLCAADQSSLAITRSERRLQTGLRPAPLSTEGLIALNKICSGFLPVLSNNAVIKTGIVRRYRKLKLQVPFSQPIGIDIERCWMHPRRCGYSLPGERWTRH